MHPPEKMTAVVDGRRYSVATATLLAGDDYWDGHNYERNGTNTFLYRTQKGTYFFVHLTQWEGSYNSISPCSIEDAQEFFDRQSNEREVSRSEAFPGVVIPDA